MRDALSSFADIATIVTGIAVICAVIPFHYARTQRCRDSDQWYVDRYWTLQDQKRTRRTLNGNIMTVVPLRTLCAELRLCEDELDARAQGWVTNDSWEIWQDSIANLSKDKAMMKALAAMPSGELVRLREFLNDGKDPQRIGPVRQWWRGIR